MTYVLKEQVLDSKDQIRKLATDFSQRLKAENTQSKVLSQKLKQLLKELLEQKRLKKLSDHKVQFVEALLKQE